MSEAPSLSVVMCIRNVAPFLDAALDSIRAQTWPNFEFLVCDDGSDDDSAAILARHAQDDSRIIAFFGPNRGLVMGLESLLERARAPLIARMDGDDIAHPDRFALQMRFLEANPDHVLVGSQRHLIDARGQLLNIGHKPVPLDHQAIMTRKTGPAIFHSSVIFRRDSVRAAGGYRRAYLHCEDLDLWLRLSRYGKFANLADSLLYYRVHTAQTSQSQRARQIINAAIARLMDQRVRAGLGDPSGALDQLPDIDHLDDWLGTEGIAAQIRSECAATLLCEPLALAQSGLPLMLDHIQTATKLDQAALWRGIARLVRARQFSAATQLSHKLLRRITTV